MNVFRNIEFEYLRKLSKKWRTKASPPEPHTLGKTRSAVDAAAGVRFLRLRSSLSLKRRGSFLIASRSEARNVPLPERVFPIAGERRSMVCVTSPLFSRILSPSTWRASSTTRERKPGRKGRAAHALAVLATILSLAAGIGLRLPVDPTALPCVLWWGFRHGDRTAFARYRLPDGKEERYAWRRELVEQELHGHDPDFP